MYSKFLKVVLFSILTICSFFTLPDNLHAQVSVGDTLQLFSYYGTTDQPAPIDGDISGANVRKWKNAYVRSITVTTEGGTNRNCYVFLTDDGTYLYVAIAALIGDAGDVNYARIYFDQNHNHNMDVSTSTLYGEYYVEARTTGGKNGGWNGSNWYEYSSTPEGFEAMAARHGTGAETTWNFEFKIPMQGGKGPNNECYLNIGPQSEVGIQIFVYGASDKNMYWTPTNQNNTDPSGWGDLQVGILPPDRTISAPVALGSEPVIDGYVLNDPMWSHYTSFKRNIIFTNYAGSTISGTIYAKTGTSDLYLGLVVSTSATVGDYLSLLQDYKSGTGGDVDYELTNNSENSAVIVYTGAGTGDYIDGHFVVGPAWTADASQDGSGAVRHNGTSYEFECRIPLKGTGSYDLQITTGTLLGFNPKLLLKGSTFWWTAGTNSEWQRVRLDNNVYTSLGWVHLQTGAPIVQAVFPKNGDEVSGHYPFTIWATGAGGTTEIGSAMFSDDMGQSWKSLEQVDDEGFWTKTWDTTVLSDGSKEIRIKVIDKNGREATLTIMVTVDNTQVVTSAPSVIINSPSPAERVRGTVAINFTETPVPPKTISSREISIDGSNIWTSIPSTYTYLWDTTSLPDGAHIFRIRATDNQGVTGYSDYRLVIVDNSVPYISNVTVEYPSGQTMAKQGDVVRISAMVFDDSGINPSSVILDATNLSGTTHIMVDDGTNGDKVAGDNIYTYNVTVTTNATGTVTFTITASDNEGNSAAPVTGSVLLDNTAPVININPVISPTKYPSQTITGTYIETNLDSIKVNGVLADVFVSSWSANISLIPGTNTVTAVITDKANNIAEATTTVVYDPYAPVSIIAPRSNSILKGIQIIEIASPDITTKVRFQVSPDNGVSWYSVTGSISPNYTEDTQKSDGWKVSWDTVSDGLPDSITYQVRATAYDEQNKIIASDTVDNITIDNTPPVLTSMEGIINTFTFVPIPRVVRLRKEVYVPSVQMKFKVIDATAGIGKVKVKSVNKNGDEIYYAEVNPTSEGRVVQYIPLAEGYNMITVEPYDKVGNVAPVVVDTIYYVVPKESSVIGPEGGFLESPDGSSVVIPNGALLKDTKISIKVVPAEELIKPTNPNIKLVGVARDFGPSGIVFNKPVTITIAYTSADLDPDYDGVANFDENKLEIFFWSGTDWVKVACKNRDTTLNTISADVNHFTIFALAEDTNPAPEKLQVYLTKNPFRAETQTTFVYGLNKEAKKVIIEIYDLSGDLVHKMTKEGNLSGWDSLNWNGENRFGNYVGSGIYLYRFTVEYTDGSKETLKQTVGVVK